MNGLFIPLVLSVITVSARDQWNTNYKSALMAARNNHKPLVVVLENTKDPDEALSQSTLELDENVASLLGKYELCRIDVSTEYGQKIANAFGASEFPFTAISDTNCKVIRHRNVGRPTVQVWKQILAQNPRPRRNQSFRSPIQYQYRPTTSRVCYT